MSDEKKTLERLTVNLIPRSSEALRQASDTTGISKTDTVNRALQVYSFLIDTIKAGGQVYIREAGDKDLQRALFL